jgi:hypothetical protein
MATGAGSSEADAGEGDPVKLPLLETPLVEKISPFFFAHVSGAALGADATHCWAVVGAGERMEGVESGAGGGQFGEKVDACVYREVGGGSG